MPIYVYEVVFPPDPNDPEAEEEAGQVFEYEQRMDEPPLTQHPTTGQPVRRVIRPTNIGGKWSGGSSKHLISDKNIADKGFTKYVKVDDGKYEKVAGKGPKRINKPPEPPGGGDPQ